MSSKPNDVKTYKLEELAERVGVSPRTVRYYVQRGLLAAPAFRGKDTVYSEDHLARLQAIRRLQERFLPLDEIQSLLARHAPDELAPLVDAISVPMQILPLPRVESPATPSPGATWERFTLAPGLELNLATDAAPAVRALANKIRRIADGGTK